MDEDDFDDELDEDVFTINTTQTSRNLCCTNFPLKKRSQGYSNVAKMSYSWVIYSNKRSYVAVNLAVMGDQE